MIERLWNEKNLLRKTIKLINKLFYRVNKNISETIDILNENYGENRDADKDLEGYVLIIERIEDVKELKNGRLKDILSEYTDKIMCSEEVNYTSFLFLICGN